MYFFLVGDRYEGVCFAVALLVVVGVVLYLATNVDLDAVFCHCDDVNFETALAIFAVPDVYPVVGVDPDAFDLEIHGLAVYFLARVVPLESGVQSPFPSVYPMNDAVL